MLPRVHNVVHYQGYYKKKLGEFHECVHDRHILACHIKAGGLYISGTEKITVQAPYLGVLPAGERDANGLVGPIEMYWCAFEWSGVQSETGREVLLKAHESVIRRPHLRRINVSELRTVVSAFKELQRLSRAPDVSSQLRASVKVLELLALWADPVAVQGEERAVRFYRQLIEQYSENPEQSLEKLADKVGMSSDHLGVLFRKEMGMTPNAYRTRLRLLRARELLVSTPLNISEISRRVGFPDANYFTRVFRGTYGIRPRDYARSNLPGLEEPGQG